MARELIARPPELLGKLKSTIIGELLGGYRSVYPFFQGQQYRRELFGGRVETQQNGRVVSRRANLAVVREGSGADSQVVEVTRKGDQVVEVGSPNVRVTARLGRFTLRREIDRFPDFADWDPDLDGSD